MKHQSSIHIRNQQEADDPCLQKFTEIRGYLVLDAGIQLNLPMLAKAGYVKANKNAMLNLPVLAKAGDVIAYEGATLNLPMLAEVTYDVIAYEGATLNLPMLAKAGDVIAYDGATLNLPVLAKAGYVIADTSLLDKMVDVLLAACSGTFYVSDRCSEYMLSRVSRRTTTEYSIDGIDMPLKLFNQIRRDELTANKVFAIQNMEQRRVAYARMDKRKMAQLGYRVLDEIQNDGHGYPMRIIEIDTKEFSTPFRYLNCFCPSTGREYWLETRQTTCQAAKAASFGIPANIMFDIEY